jgi:Uma2 family endonuclease
MAEGAIRHRTLTVEEYLDLERESSVRHEYVAGSMYALAGASKRHNLIAGNIFRTLGSAAAGGPCRVYMSDVKLRASEDVFYYPDVMVACGPDEGDPFVEDAPCLLIEVASPSTATTDRREKLVAYKRIPTLEAYVIVEQDRRHVQRFWRDPEGVWWDAELVDEGQVPMACLGASMSLDEIYAGVDLPSA